MMTDKFDPGISDQDLDRVLGELKAPAPSDLLRARLDNAMGPAGHGAPVAPSTRYRRAAPRAALLARIAAALLIAAVTGLAAWLPAPGAVSGPGSVAVAPAPVPSSWQAALEEDTPGDPADEAEFGLALVGGDGTAMDAVALVRADWTATLASADDDAGFAADGGGGEAEAVSDLEAIPLD